MPIQWTTYRLLLSASPGLASEQQAFEAANASFAERVTMPAWILFALASTRSGFDPQVNRNGVESNIRFCDFFLQVFGETAPDPAFFGFLKLAIACTRDPVYPMRSTVVAFRNPENASPELSALRRRLLDGGDCQVHDFHSLDDFNRLAEQILADWYALIQDHNKSASIGPQ